MRIVRFLPAGVNVSALFRGVRHFLRAAAFAGVALAAGTAGAQTAAPELGGFKFSAGAYQAGEGDLVTIVTVTRTNVTGKLAVDLVTVNDVETNEVTAAATNTLVFDQFQASVQVLLPVMDNSLTNAGGTATLRLENPRAAAGEDTNIVAVLGTPAEATLKLLDNDAAMKFNFEFSRYLVEEGGTVDIRVLLAQPPGPGSADVAVDYEVQTGGGNLSAGSESAGGSDVVVQTGTLSFGEADVEQVITVEISTDELIEFNEDFLVVLSNARGQVTPEAPATDGGGTGGTDAGTDGGGTGGTDAGTDGGGTGEPAAPEPLPFALGEIATATVTIVFNGDPAHPQPAGSVDQTFNPDGSPNTVPPFNLNPGANDTVYSVFAQPDGRTVIGGVFTAVNATVRNRIARLSTNGTLDVTFNPPGGANDFVAAVAVYTNGPHAGKIIAGGGFTSMNGEQRIGVARLNEDGSLDTSFNPGLGANGPVYAVAVQLDGSVLIGGEFTTFDGIPRNRIARLLPDGQLDLSFDPGEGANSAVYAIYPEPVAPVPFEFTMVGTEPHATNVVLDLPSSNGFLQFELDFGSQSNQVILLDSRGNIFDSGIVMTTTNIVDTNNVVIGTTNIPIRVAVEVIAPQNFVTFIVNPSTNAVTNWVIRGTFQPAANDAILVGGDFWMFDGIEHGGIAKLSAAGAADTNFAANLGIGASGPVRAIGMQSDGKIVIGGGFLSFNSVDVRGIARLEANGRLDEAFGVGEGANGTVFSIDIQGDDKIMLGGDFTAINETRRVFVARLMTNGVVDTTFMDTAYNEFAGFPHSQGLFPNGSVQSVSLDAEGNLIVGGIFEWVGGGGGRAAQRPRGNFARLVGGETEGPGVIGFLGPVFGVDEDGTALVASAERTGGTLGGAFADVATMEATALAGVDYEETTNIVGWPAVNSVGLAGPVPFLVPIIDDEEIEGTEHFNVEMSDPRGSIVLGGQFIPTYPAFGVDSFARGNIIEDDTVPSTISFARSAFDVNENDGMVTIDVMRTGGTSSSVSVQYAAESPAAPGAATEDEDFFRAAGSLQFNAGQTNRTFTVRVRDDAVVEQDETVALRLFSPSAGAVLGSTNVLGTLTIIDNDYAPGRVSFSATNYTVVEGDLAEVTIRRTGGNVGVLRVDYATTPDSATLPFDYQETSGSLVWNDRESGAKTILVPINQDGLVEGGEQLNIRLSNAAPSGALGVRTNSTITILDDDTLGAFSFNAAEYLADETGTNVIITVVRSGGDAEAATVDYATTNLTATAGEDYEATSGTLAFGIGESIQTFSVPVINDAEENGERTIGLVLSNPQPEGAVLGILSEASIAIIDDESFNIPAGSLEADFATGDGANDSIHAVLLQPDGKIVLGGDFTVINNQVRDRLARLNADGTLDLVFGRDFAIDGPIRDLAIQPDGRIIIGGAFTTIDGLPQRRVARITSGGSLDSTFNVGAGADGQVLAVETYVPDTNAPTRILIGGSFSVYNGVNRRGIARIQMDGRADPTFNPGTGVNGTVYAIAVQRDGKILVGGEFSSINGAQRINIARLNADGTLDESFNAGLGADGSVRAIAVQLDGRILIGGLFVSVSGVERRHLARLNADGTLDPSLDPGLGANGAVYTVAIQRDGKIVIGGDFTSYNAVPRGRIARLNPDGTLDPTINFGSGANGFITSIAVQPDRKLIIGGGFTEFNGQPRGRIARVYGGSIAGPGEIEFESAVFTATETSTNAVVTVRRSGGLSGVVSAEYRSEAGTADAALDYADVSGTVVFLENENIKTFTLPILNDNQPEPVETVSLRLENGTGGVPLTRQPVATLEILSDDSLLGFAEASFTVNEGGRATIFVRREGETAFPASVIYSTSGGTAGGADFQNVSGVLNFAAGQSLQVFTVQTLDDTGVEGNESVNLSLSLAGTGGFLGRSSAALTIIDNDFAPGVLNLVSTSGASESSGAITITVQRVSGTTGAVTVDYGATSLSAIPGEDFTPVSGTLTFLEGETIKTIVVPVLDDDLVEGNEAFSVGLARPTGGAQLGTASLFVTIIDDDFGPGSFDTSFSVGSGASGPVWSMLRQPDGKIVIGGEFQIFDGFQFNRVARLNANGSIDNSFQPGQGLNGPVYSVGTENGNIITGGDFTTFGTINRRSVGRFLTNGLADPNFNRSAGENGPVFSVAPQADGKIIIGGDFTTPSAYIARLNQNGSLDVSFNTEGGADAPVFRVRLQEDGRVLAGGSFTRMGSSEVAGLVRLMPDGLLDSSFQIGSGVNGAVLAITIAPDGKILIGGDFNSVNGTARPSIARLNADGSVDLSFIPNTAPNGVIRDIAVHLGKIYVAGEFTQFGTTNRSRVARLNIDGTLDASFDPGLGPDGAVYDIDVQQDGQILIAGAFTTVNGFFSPGIARLNGDASSQPAAVRIQATRVEEGEIVLSYTSEVGRTYVIEASSDLLAWETVATSVASGSSSEFREPAGGSHRFYRIRVQ